jgi:Uma2 family endonuclease
MPTKKPRVLLEILFYEAAQEYQRNLPPEHYMESTTQAWQRKIFVETMDVVHEYRPDIQTFSELLVQYLDEGQKKPRQVVPDNMVVVHDQPIQAVGSFDVPLQPARPFWMLEYVSKSNKRKDYDDNMERYERDLKVPYYLLFEPDVQELTLYKLTRGHYVSVKPNGSGRYPIPKLEMELAMVDGWVRFWFRGDLVPLPGELLKQVNEFRQLWEQEKHRADEEKHRADEEKHRADEAEKRALAAEQDLVRLRALLDQSR